ncbi:phosphate/phosphite/phosphonate ABC transporter substrate-binding protein [Sulfitobacter noctilucicola]|nr:PhnD/SsuA/transferrin family substrate-binding protein [Sulfitobacter noctilucicola]
MMYNRPEIAAENARYWGLIRQAFAARGIEVPRELSNDADEFDVWLSPDLVFSQTCGLPYRTTLNGHVALVGTPDFGLEGCPAGHYKSAVLVRADDPREALSDFQDARFVFNQSCSQSGYGTAYHLAQEHGFWFTDRKESGGHVLSAKAVAEGSADIAFVDAHTYRFIERYDTHGKNLRVLTYTAPTPATPYITADAAQADAMFEGVRAAVAALDHADREVLGLNGVVRISHDAYCAVPNPPDATF